MATILYGVLRSRASRPAWMLRELGEAHERVPVIQANRLPDPHAPDAPLSTASPAFRRINPNGLIPTLADGGLVLHESLAITLHLAETRGGPLAPRDARERSLAVMWSLWAATAVEPRAIEIVYHGPRGSKGHDPAVSGAAEAALGPPLSVLEAALAEGGGHLLGGRFTVADLNLAEVLRYAQGAPALFEGRPALSAWIAACQSRPAFRAMMAERDAEAA